MVPYTIFLLRSMCFGEIDLGLNGQNCECTSCVKKQGQRVSKARLSWLRLGFLFKMLFAALLWYTFFLTYEKVAEIKPIKSFDPYEILEVTADMDVKKFKS